MYRLTLIDSFGRFEVQHVIDQAGDPVALLTTPTGLDPEGISGNAATLSPVSGYAGPRWMLFVDHIGRTPNRGTYPTTIKGDPARILAAIEKGA